MRSSMKRDVSVILLFDKDKKILLQKRTKDAPASAGNWAFFGGGINPGETPEQTLAREAYEELRYTPKKPIFITTQEFLKHPDDTEKSLKHVFMEAYDLAQTLILGEGEAMNWFTIAETDALKMSNHDRAVLKQIQGTY